MIIHTFEQHTSEWTNARLGKFTASKGKQLMMGLDTAGYQGLVNQIVYERLTGEAPEEFRSEWMARGNEAEPFAREAYENLKFVNVTQVGFIEQDEWCGFSPDGIVGDDGLVEIKSPKHSTLIDYLCEKKVPPEYMKQIQFGLMVSGRKWCDFFAWHPKIRPLLIRVERDEKQIEAIRVRLKESIELVKHRLIEVQGTPRPSHAQNDPEIKPSEGLSDCVTSLGNADESIELKSRDLSAEVGKKSRKKKDVESIVQKQEIAHDPTLITLI